MEAPSGSFSSNLISNGTRLRQKSRHQIRQRMLSHTHRSLQIQVICPYIMSGLADIAEHSLLLATHTVSGSILVYRVKINWNAQPGKSASPTFDISPLKAEDNCCPLGTNFDTGDATLGPSQKLSLPAKLTHLSFIATGPDPGPSPSFPTVLAVFCHTPAPVPSLMDQTHTQQPPFSIVARWELHSSTYSLHSGFEQLTTKKKAPGLVGQRVSATYHAKYQILMRI